jgi:hypothetical protein
MCARLLARRQEATMKAQDETSTDPKVHTARLRQELSDVIDHLRRDIGVVSEPQARALFETSAEVLQGLVKAYDDYDAGKEAAFRR